MFLGFIFSIFSRIYIYIFERTFDGTWAVWKKKKKNSVFLKVRCAKCGGKNWCQGLEANCVYLEQNIFKLHVREYRDRVYFNCCKKNYKYFCPNNAQHQASHDTQRNCIFMLKEMTTLVVDMRFFWSKRMKNIFTVLAEKISLTSFLLLEIK